MKTFTPKTRAPWFRGLGVVCVFLLLTVLWLAVPEAEVDIAKSTDAPISRSTVRSRPSELKRWESPVAIVPENPTPPIEEETVPEGIGLYAKMVKPFRIGVVVPDDYVLPEGYVRHYQVNEDGTPLKPILMYHPDFHPKDKDGSPIPIPDDLIVPGDQLPKGLDAVMLEVPTVYFDGGIL
jgi:hypothetical protein